MFRSISILIAFLSLAGICFGQSSSLNQSSQDYEPGQLFIRFEDGRGLGYAFAEGGKRYHWSPVLEKWAQELGAVSLENPFILDHPDLINTYVLKCREEIPTELLNLLNKHEDIRYAERVPHYEIFYTPNDPSFNQQWHLQTIQAENAWNLGQGNSNVVVAIIDDAVLLNHQDLAPSIWVNPGEIAGNNIDDDGNGYIDDINGWDAADNDNDPNPPAATVSNNAFAHGTHVAGITGAATDNSIGIASIGFDLKLMAVKTKTDASTGGSLQAPYQGVQYAIATGPDVMNMSWGGGAFSQTYQALFDQAFAQGIVSVAAAGNSNTSAPMYPASYNNVISVGATAQGDSKASFSNFGPTIDVMAPGAGIYSTLPGSVSSYGNNSGTSMASPLVAGLAGLMIAYDPTLTPTDLELCLKSSCDNIDAQNPGYIGDIGSGRVNAFEALNCLKPISAVFSANFTQVCPGGQVQFTDMSTNSPNSWQWTFQGGIPATSNQANPLVTYPNPGAYDVTLIVANPQGIDTLVETAFITVATPTAVLSGGATIISGFSASLQVAFTGNAPWDFTYSDGTNTTTITGITQNPYFFQVSPTLTTTYTATAVSDSLCAGLASGSAVVNILQNSSCNSTSSYSRTYGGINDEYGTCLDHTTDGGVIIGGYTESFGAGNIDYYLLKLDACGYVEWDKTFGSNAAERISAVEQTQDGGYIVCGYSYYNNGGNWSNWLIKLDALGNIVWSNSYGNSNFDYPRACVELPNGDLAIAEVSAAGAGANDIGLIRVSSTGVTQWARSYGQNANEFVSDIQAVPGGGMILHGYRRDYGPLRTAFLLRVDATGNVMWAKEYGSAGINVGNAAVTVLNNGQGFAICGYAGPLNSWDAYYIRTDLNGNVTQSQSYGGPANDLGRQLVEIPNGDLYYFMTTESGVSGNSDFYLARIDSTGAFLGGVAVGGSGADLAWNASDKAKLTTAGNLYYFGSTASYGAGGRDYYLIKTDVNGVPPCDDTQYTMPVLNFPVITSNVNFSVLTRTVPGIAVVPTVTDPPTFEGINCNSSAPPPFCITVKGHQKISDTQGNFLAPMDNNDQFGAAVVSVGDINLDGVQDLAVSANLDDDGGNDRGAFYILFMNTNGTVQNYTKIASNTGGFTGNLYNLGAMGSQIEPLGDMNGDGIPDLAVGVSRDMDGGTMQGALFILFMNANGTVASQQKISETQGGFGGNLDPQDRFGNTITNIGDLNSDGVIDLAVSAPFDDDGGNETGAVWILYLNANGTVSSEAKISATSGGITPGTLDPADNFGTGVTSIGDFDGNGTHDLMVGARLDDDGGMDRGAIYILTLNPNGSVLSQSKISSTSGNLGPFIDNGDRFGISGDNMGDLNGDGVTDVLVGAYLDDDGGTDKGAAYILFLNANATVQNVFKISETAGGFTGVPDVGGLFSWAVSQIGDLDNNGMVDLAIGEVHGDDGGTNRGAAWIIYLEDSCQCQYGNMNTFQRWYGGTGDDEGHSIKKTLDGNLIVAGVTTSAGAGNKDIYVMKMDIYGNPLWSRTYGTTAVEDGHSVRVLPTTDGGYLVTGDSDIGGSPGMLIMKLDATGNVTWQRIISGSQSDLGRAAAETSDGGYAIGGTSISYTAGGNSDAYLAKINSTGTLLWSMTIGGNQADHVVDVEEADNGDLIWALVSRSFGLGTRTAHLVRTTANGVLVWEKIYDGPLQESFNDIDLTSDGGIIAAGRTDSWGNVGATSFYIVKTDSAGNLAWARTIGGTQLDRAATVEQTTDGGYFVSGPAESVSNGGIDILGVKLDAQGNLDWARSYGGNLDDAADLWGNASVQASDGGFYMVGTTNSFNNAGNDIYLVKTDVCGNSWCNELDVTNVLLFTSPTPTVSDPPSVFGTGGATASISLVDGPVSFNDSILCFSILPPSDSCLVVSDFTADTVCFGDTTFFYDMTVDTGTVNYWEWNYGDGNGSLGQPNPGHVYGAPGVYLVILISGNSCFDTITHSVLVIDSIGIVAPNDTTICQGDSILLVPNVISCGVPPYTFSWSPAAGLNNPTLEMPTASPGVTTIYTVTVTDLNGNTASDQVTITVDQTCCVSHAEITGDSLVCVGSSLQFTNNSNASAGANYTWNFGPGTIPGTFIGANPPPVQFNTIGVQQVQLIVNDVCGSDTTYFNVYVNPLPQAFAGNDTTICAGAIFMIGDSNLTYHSYSWTPATGLSDPAISNPIATITNSITYIVTITDDITGCSTNDTIQILVNPTPTVQLPQDTILCQGSSLQIVPVVTNVTTYLWSDNSAGTTLTVSNPGWVWLIGSNLCQSDTDSIYVDFVPPTTVDLGPDLQPCAGTTVTLTPTVTNSTGLLWSDNSTGNTLQVTANGTYWVESSNPICGPVRDSIVITYILDPEVELPADTVLCQGSSLQIQPTVSDVTTYLWSDNSSGTSLAVNSSGWVWLIGSNACGADTDSVFVDFVPPTTVDLGPDLQPCEGTVITLTPTVSNSSGLLWSDNSTGTSLQVITSGTYWVESSNPICGSVRDSVSITYIDAPGIELPEDTAICDGQILQLVPVVTGIASVSWQDGTISNTYNVTNPGLYWAVATNVCGSDTDSIAIEVAPPIVINLGPDTTICEDDTLYLDPGLFTQYLWQDGFTGNPFPAYLPGYYFVNVVDSNGCTGTDNIRIWTENCLRGLYVPNAFTPDGNQTNDVFQVVENGFTLENMRIYDRWGKLIYEAYSVNDPWDGTFSNQPVQEGAYVWVIEYRDHLSRKGTLKGTVTVYR